MKTDSNVIFFNKMSFDGLYYIKKTVVLLFTMGNNFLVLFTRNLMEIFNYSVFSVLPFLKCILFIYLYLMCENAFSRDDKNAANPCVQSTVFTPSSHVCPHVICVWLLLLFIVSTPKTNTHVVSAVVT